MDLVGACRAFVSVSERGSFTVGAAALRMSQSVASRRIAALEQRYGERLFERTARQAVLTPFGQELLPAARQVVRAADGLAHEAEVAKRRPWRLAVPATCGDARLARLVADARGEGIVLEVRVAPASERAELARSQQVRAALVGVPGEGASWSVPLGLAGELEVSRVYVASLRPQRRATEPPRRIWIQPEDDVPHVRDPLTRLRDASGLRADQVAVAPDLTSAAAETLCSRDLLLCSPGQADALGLTWRPIGDLPLVRGFALVGAPGVDLGVVHDRLGAAIARCLGASA